MLDKPGIFDQNECNRKLVLSLEKKAVRIRTISDIQANTRHRKSMVARCMRHTALAKDQPGIGGANQAAHLFERTMRTQFARSGRRFKTAHRKGIRHIGVRSSLIAPPKAGIDEAPCLRKQIKRLVSHRPNLQITRPQSANAYV
ncbi:hypothetical protein KQI08_05035 [Paraeggerthella hongkongensis]|uniref:hypothetical protein n=1 Tax=Paraeggerthella TaxID=651554 RepID=UPI001C0F6CDB|nr:MULTISPECIES: hypothetical protein [Paraeggerthella]MBU5405286.1 hypothetical protein [Paraeggerthella hongkongensis]MCD2433345.1 hypothetical protein [Paraeggerthella hominis]